MKKLVFTVLLSIVSTFFYNPAYAKEDNLADIIWGYKKTETISLDEYLQRNNASFSLLKLNKNGDVTHKGKVIITPAGTPINDFTSGNSYLLFKIYLVAKGTKPRENCNEQDTKTNGAYGLGCYIDTPEEMYKEEIENIAKEEIETIKKFIDKDVEKAKEIYKKASKDKNTNRKEHLFILQDYQHSIEEHEIMFLARLIDITTHYNVIEKIPATDNAKALLTFLYPYFKQANINYQKIDELDKYTAQKIREVDNLIQKL